MNFLEVQDVPGAPLQKFTPSLVPRAGTTFIPSHLIPKETKAKGPSHHQDAGIP